MNDKENPAGYVALDEVGNGAPYVLQAGQGQHLAVRSSLRSLLTRKEDTEGHMGLTYCEGDTFSLTPPHYHHNTTEAVYVLNGVLRVWQHTQKGTRIVSELESGALGCSRPAGPTHGRSPPRHPFPGCLRTWRLRRHPALPRPSIRPHLGSTAQDRRAL